MLVNISRSCGSRSASQCHLARTTASTSMSCRNLSGECYLLHAEDGIRDLTVTGVQTCALPISSMPGEASSLLMVDHNASKARRRDERTKGTLDAHPLAGIPFRHRYSSNKKGLGVELCPISRSGERRGGEESRSRGSPYH